jgi:UDP-glucose-4-epimerase GalE
VDFLIQLLIQFEDCLSYSDLVQYAGLYHVARPLYMPGSSDELTDLEVRKPVYLKFLLLMNFSVLWTNAEAATFGNFPSYFRSKSDVVVVGDISGDSPVTRSISSSFLLIRSHFKDSIRLVDAWRSESKKANSERTQSRNSTLNSVLLSFYASSKMNLEVLPMRLLSPGTRRRQRFQNLSNQIRQYNHDYFLVTGAAGYIGLHTCLHFLDMGHYVLGVDDLSRGSLKAIEVLECHSKFKFFLCNVADEGCLASIFATFKITAILHFAGVAFVEESVRFPKLYFQNITNTTKAFARFSIQHGVSQFLFASTCAVYGQPRVILITESTPTKPMSPYGESKLAAENEIFFIKSPGTVFRALRFFNVIGADPEGRLGEMQNPSTFSYARIWTQCLLYSHSKITEIPIFGNNFNTTDGTPIRDFIHVYDLVRAHYLLIFNYKGNKDIFNLGGSMPTSVLNFIDVCQRVINRHIHKKILPGSDSSASVLQADSSSISNTVQWMPIFTDLYLTLKSAYHWDLNKEHIFDISANMKRYSMNKSSFLECP